MASNGGLRAAIAKVLNKGLEEEAYKPPEKRTWAEKVTDENNAWIAARRLEMEDELQEAAHEYARDAEIWLDLGHEARAALSLTCEARCMKKLGIDGTVGYKRAGELYEKAGWRSMRKNPHEALQLFERARECYGLAGERRGEAKAVKLCDSLAATLHTSAGNR